MSRRKRANPVRVSTYNEENGDNEAIVPNNSYQYYNDAFYDNCNRGQGKPIMIDKPVLELLHTTCIKNFSEKSSLPEQLDSTKPLAAFAKQTIMKTLAKRIPITKPITVNKNNITKINSIGLQNPNLITQLTQQLNGTQNVLQLKPNTSIVVPQPVQIAPHKEPIQFTPVFTAAESSPPPPPTPPTTSSLPLSKEAMLDELREKAVAIKTCMKLTMEEVEALIFGGKVVRVVSNRKKPDQSLKYECKFCIYFNHDTNGDVKMRSFGRKEEIKRHHMLHLRYERFQCQYCPYKVVRSDHLHRHMKNKHPEINHPGPQSNRRKQLQIGNGDYEGMQMGISSGDLSTAQFPGMEYSTNSFNSSAFIEEDADDDDFGSNLLPKTEPVNDDASLTTEAIKSLLQSESLSKTLLQNPALQKLLNPNQNETDAEPDEDDETRELVIDTSENFDDGLVKSELIDDEPTVKRIKFDQI